MTVKRKSLKVARAEAKPLEQSVGAWTVVIPDWLPTPLNRLMRMHWKRRDETLKGEYSLIWGHCRMANVPRATGKRRITMRLTLQPVDSRRDYRGQLVTFDGADRERDSDGCFKGTLDGLVQAGMLVDDSPDWVVSDPVEYDRGPRRMTTLTIEDLYVPLGRKEASD